MIETKKHLPVFRKRLRELRGKMTQKEVAAELGISRASLGFYEEGSRRPDIAVLLKIADFYNVSCDYLLGLTRSKRRDDCQDGNGEGLLNDSKIRQIVDFFGDEPQIRQAMEECAELIVALNKYLRYKDDPKKLFDSKKSVIEEMADVCVMLRQLEYIFGESGEIENLSDYKIDRTMKIISERRVEE